MEPQLKQEIQAAFENYDREVTVSNFKVASILGILLMPAGLTLDYFVYPEHLREFLVWRLSCSIFIACFLSLLLTAWGRRHHRTLGMILLMLPTLFISLMIHHTEGPSSPYYAGLNLVLLMMGFVLHWTFRESLVAAALVLGMYLGACFFYKGELNYHEVGVFFNNLYFLILTGVIVVTGSYFLNLLRFREFAGRYELDRNKQQLEATNRKLLELDQVKSRFFANISHELRTPLTLLIAPLETLQHQRHKLSETAANELLASMLGNAMRLLKLINDLLELVRLDSGVLQVKREAIDVTSFVQGLTSAARQLAQDRRLTLSASVEPALGSVMADRDKLEKIILNLQFNALKFTPPGGRVEVLAAKENDELVLRVKDTGMGIAEKDLPNVFGRFWQADSSERRKYQGVGIGLALVKELTEIQGGSVSVASVEGQGTTFTVRLPYLPAEPQAPSAPETAPGESLPETERRAAANPEWLSNLYHRADLFPAMPGAAAPSAPREARPASNLKILIADDEPDMRRFLKFELQSDFQVFEAPDGNQALLAAAHCEPDLVIVDMMMPEKDGLQVCSELRQQKATQNTPIIMITARADEKTKLAALAAGANDFLTKPFSTAELHLRVANLVSSQQFQTRLGRQNKLLQQTIEQLKETEAQLVQTEKLASLGRMSAGIIHEINNPLNYAKTGLYALRQCAHDLPPDQRATFEELIKEIEDGVNRIKNIVQDLGPFAREHPAAFDDQNVAQMVESALRFISHRWKDKVTIQRDISPDLTVWANQVRIIQVLLNLFQNSVDALENKSFDQGFPTLWISACATGGFCILTVRDNGPGIPREVLPKIFEPFFTTKDVGAGMGLGLNICYRIVQDHRGSIHVKSEPGEFCEFTLELPTQPPTADN